MAQQPSERAQQPEKMAASYWVDNYIDQLPSCRCNDTWTTIDDPQCMVQQRGCESDPCDGDLASWCVVETAPCLQGRGKRLDWFYCMSPPPAPTPPPVIPPSAPPPVAGLTLGILVPLSEFGTGRSDVWRQQLLCAALLAVDDVGLRGACDEAVVPELCALVRGPVHVRALVFDSEDSEPVAIRRFIEAEKGGAHGIIAGRSSIARTLSLLANVYTLPLLSFWASSTTLSNAALYPLFARTFPSDSVAAGGLFLVLCHFNWKQFAIIFAREEYATSYNAGLRELAASAGTKVMLSSR